MRAFCMLRRKKVGRCCCCCWRCFDTCVMVSTCEKVACENYVLHLPCHRWMVKRVYSQTFKHGKLQQQQQQQHEPLSRTRYKVKKRFDWRWKTQNTSKIFGTTNERTQPAPERERDWRVVRMCEGLLMLSFIHNAYDTICFHPGHPSSSRTCVQNDATMRATTICYSNVFDIWFQTKLKFHLWLRNKKHAKRNLNMGEDKSGAAVNWIDEMEIEMGKWEIKYQWNQHSAFKWAASKKMANWAQI